MISGFVVALVTLLVLGFVIPRTHARKAILTQTPLSERFSEDLRIVRAPALAIEGDGERGTIFTTERKMTTETNKSPKATSSRRLPTVARERSRAKARVSRRAANRVRGLLGIGVLAAITLVLWIVVGVSSVPAAVGIVATVITGLAAVGFGFAVSEWAKADDADIKTIENATKVLSKAKRKRAKAAKNIAGSQAKKPATAPARRSGKERADVSAPVSDVSAEAVPAQAERAQAESAQPAPATVTDGGATSTSAQAEAETTSATQAKVASQNAVASQNIGKSGGTVARAANPASEPRQKAGFVPAPSYTLKSDIPKRVVKPYEAPEAPEAALPYRPKRVGERLGDAAIEVANPAPEMTGEEELRTDLLGGGSTLDKLLEQRRA